MNILSGTRDFGSNRAFRILICDLLDNLQPYGVGATTCFPQDCSQTISAFQKRPSDALSLNVPPHSRPIPIRPAPDFPLPPPLLEHVGQVGNHRPA